VVVGVVETHKRQEIENMVKDFSILPRLTIRYHHTELSEFDLDAALKRSPGLILMDEMAHTNAPNLRHKKRWQDIKELLDRGIDVYTTLNVQHIESLNDDVARIIHAPVKETVPDSMIEMADAIELVDIPPEELLKRLSEGKVYVPEQAELAAESFFRKGNLIALRELALRTVARRVNAQALLYRHDQGIKQIWPIVEKILICVGPGLESLKTIRAAKRMAMSLQAEWVAVYVDVLGIRSSNEKRNHAIQNLRFAELLGAETRVLTGHDIVKEIIEYASEQNVTLIMIWKTIRPRWRQFLVRSLADEILRYSGDIDVYTMTGKKQAAPQKTSHIRKRTPWFHYALATGIVGLATGISFLLYPFLQESNLIMIYLAGMMLTSLLGRVGPSILGSLLSVLAYDFFFIPPYYSFLIDNTGYFFTLLVMILIAQVISQLTIRTRSQAKAARLAENQTMALYKLSRKLSRTRGILKLLKTSINYISEIFDSEVLALLLKKNNLVIRARSRTTQELDEKEQSIAQWVYDMGQKAGLGTDTLSFSKALYIPLSGSQGVLGVLRLQPIHSEEYFSPERIQFLEACANQIALAIEVDSLHEQKRKSELQTESNRVRSALLQAFSHDLRSPLLSIMNTASTQMELAKQMHIPFVATSGKQIFLEAEQLSRLINNLLQIHYLETNKIILNKELYSFKEIILTVVKISNEKLSKRVVHIDVRDNLPLVSVDNGLIQDVLLNLIDNIIKFTPPESPIDIHIDTEKETLLIVSIQDHGPGIISEEANKLFEKFYRGRKLTSERGLGLGLAICRIIIEAHGGKIWVENYGDGGAAFRFTLPIGKI
jgi:two-component system sensor histidine kinase KdpD